MLKTGTATLTHVQAYPRILNLIFLAAFVQAFRATWRWHAQRHETVTVSIPVAETWQPRKAMRARSIIGGLLVGLGLIGIVTATSCCPASRRSSGGVSTGDSARA